VKNPGMAGDNLQKALQYTLHSDQYYSALNKQDTSGTPMGFYYCPNKRQVVLDPLVKNSRLTMFIGVLFALTAAKC
jgi:hypothetical protein